MTEHPPRSWMWTDTRIILWGLQQQLNRLEQKLDQLDRKVSPSNNSGVNSNTQEKGNNGKGRHGYGQAD